VDASSQRHQSCQDGFVVTRQRAASDLEISILAIDLANNSFQVCGVNTDGVAVLKQISVENAADPAFIRSIALYCGDGSVRYVALLGADGAGTRPQIRIIPAIYVKPCVKQQKNDCADALAIAVAASRPNMRFVAVKRAGKQGRAVAFRTHQSCVRQRTQLINALRGHLAEFGVVAPKGPVFLKNLQSALNGLQVDLPTTVCEMRQLYPRQIGQLTEMGTRLANELEAATKTRLRVAASLHRAGHRPSKRWCHRGVRSGP
jgi:transposase